MCVRPMYASQMRFICLRFSIPVRCRSCRKRWFVPLRERTPVAAGPGPSRRRGGEDCLTLRSTRLISLASHAHGHAARCYRLVSAWRLPAIAAINLFRRKAVIARRADCLSLSTVREGEGAVPPASERWPEPVRDASSIDWKPGMRAALMLAVPAGLLSSGISPLSVLGIFWMAGAAAWAVMLYMRSQRPAWITIGAGARIGLVTGLIAGWVAFGVSGVGLFVLRVVSHQGRSDRHNLAR